MSRPKHIKESAFEFLARTIVEHNSNACLIWPFYCDPRNGYGILVTPFMKNVQKAHRVAYLLTHGEWPNPLGRHTCNNRPCYNPRHIVPGTDADNTADSIRAGTHHRFPSGAANHATKITAEVAQLVKVKYPNSSARKLAMEFGVSKTTIQRIMRKLHIRPHKPQGAFRHPENRKEPATN